MNLKPWKLPIKAIIYESKPPGVWHQWQCITSKTSMLQAEARLSSFVMSKAKSHGDTARSRKSSFVAVVGFCDTTKWRQKSWKDERQRTRCVYWAIIRSQWEKCGGGWSSSNQRRHGEPSEGHTRAWQCRNVDPKRECRSHSCSGIHKAAEGFSLLNVVNGTLQASFTRTR